MKNQSLWIQVLIHFNRKNYFQNGLTIPFLLGASSVLDSDKEILTVEDFFHEAIDKSLPIKISLQRCANIGEYVIGIFDNESANYPYASQKMIYKQFGNLYITDNSFSEINSPEDILAILIDKYQKLLNQKTFSKIQRDWVDYLEVDRLQLEELK